MKNMKSLIGKKFNRLKVLNREGTNKFGQATWKCKCDCGNICIVSTHGLKNYTKSCGCLNTEVRRKNAFSMGKANKQNFKKRFFKYIKKTESCWIWIGDIEVSGYGRFWYKGKTQKAHRLAYTKLKKKKIKKGLLICHKCDNPKCVNPDHLFQGTILENLKDRDAKNRQAKGSVNGNSKLTEEKVIKILKLIKKEKKSSDIAKIYNVSWSTIDRIKKNKIWKHIERI